VGNDPQRIQAAFEEVMAGQWPPGQEIPLWDGRTAERIASAIAAWL
jgi:UDP-N-acetylglucosamine 2-epimerase (non-hydrolysing)